MHEVRVRVIKVGTWCAVSATRITGPMFCSDTIQSQRGTFDKLPHSFVFNLSGEEKEYVLPLRQCIHPYSGHLSHNILGDRITICPLWPACSSCPTPCKCFPWESSKDNMYKNNAHTKDDL